MKKVYYNDNTVGLVNLTSEGGIPYVAGTGIDITNDVISVTGMTAESAFTAYTSSTATEIGNKADTTAMTQAISEATSGKADTTAVTQAISEAVSGKVDTSTYTAYTAATDTAIGNKADTTAVTQIINEATSGKADTTAVTEAIDAAVSGKVDTTTYTAYTAATDSVLSGKQDTLSAGTGIDITDNVISVTGGGGGGGCTVEETVVYNRIKAQYNDLYGDNKITHVIFDYLGDKSSAVSVTIYFNIGNTSDSYNGWVYFDYVNHSANTASLSDYITAEYINDIQDFKVSVASAYQSTCWIIQIGGIDYERNALIPFYTISSGNPCTVISTDVVGLVEKVKGIADNSINNAQINSDKSKIIVRSYVNDGAIKTTYITLEDLDGTNGILKPDINIPLGTSGWTSVDIGVTAGGCENCSFQILGTLVHRLTYSYDEQTVDYSNLGSYFRIGLKASGSEWYSGYQYIDFVESGSAYVPSIRNQIFYGLEPTLNWDATTKKLIVNYPATYTHPNDTYGYGTYDVVVNCIGSNGCHMGSQDLLSGIEYYAEQIQPLKPYVQQLRTDVNTISGQVATKISTSAVTTAVTSGSTDNEIPTAKAVYDAIPKGGGGKAIEAGRGIAITTGETADTVAFNLPFYSNSDSDIICGNESSHAFSDKHGDNFITGYGNFIKGGPFVGGKLSYNSFFGMSNTIQNTRNFTQLSFSAVFGRDNYILNASHAFASGLGNQVNNDNEFVSGRYNVSNSASTTFGDSGNTLFSVGNGTDGSTRHNAFEIRQNGDIYYFDGTNDVKLQDKFSSIDTTIGDINTILQSI